MRTFSIKIEGGIGMKAKELIELLQRFDGDTKIIVWGECDPKRPVTLWDWTDTHGAVVLVEVDKQAWVKWSLPYTQESK